jgi:hypothetical protein
MADINSIVGTFSGVVAYMDNSVGMWHCQMEWDGVRDLKWSVQQAISQINTANIDVANGSEYFATWQNMISELPFVTTFSWGSSPPGAMKNIRELVHHLNLLMTLDDGTIYPVSVTFEGTATGGTRIDHLNADDSLSGADNVAEIISLIQEMLELVSDPGQPVMT